jgi:hypothetical protein
MFSLRPFEIEDDDRYNFILAGRNLEEITTREELVKAFCNITGRQDMEFGDLIWISKYVPTIRMVDTFGKGRVFVTGGRRFPLLLLTLF